MSSGGDRTNSSIPSSFSGLPPLFLVACYATIHPALSVRASVRHTLLFLALMGFLALLLLAKCSTDLKLLPLPTRTQLGKPCIQPCLSNAAILNKILKKSHNLRSLIGNCQKSIGNRISTIDSNCQKSIGNHIPTIDLFYNKFSFL